jgi:hypothetical protein
MIAGSCAMRFAMRSASRLAPSSRSPCERTGPPTPGARRTAANPR